MQQACEACLTGITRQQGSNCKQATKLTSLQEQKPGWPRKTAGDSSVHPMCCQLGPPKMRHRSQASTGEQHCFRPVNRVCSWSTTSGMSSHTSDSTTIRSFPASSSALARSFTWLCRRSLPPKKLTPCTAVIFVEHMLDCRDEPPAFQQTLRAAAFEPSCCAQMPCVTSHTINMATAAASSGFWKACLPSEPVTIPEALQPVP